MIGVRFSARRAARAAIFAIAALAAVGGGRASAQDPGPSPVGVDSVVVEPLDQTVPVIGRLVPRRAGVVAARTHGPVGEIMVAVGDRVEEGQVLARLVLDRVQAEVRLHEAEVAAAAAAITTKRAQLDLVRQELQRLTSLRQSAAFSQARYDDKRQEVAQVESEIAEAEAEAGRAQANLDLANIALYVATVRAPYAGIVTQRHTELGAYLTTGNPVVTLVDDSNLEIEADVPANRIGGLLPGFVVTFDLADQKGMSAAVRAIIPEENPLTRTRRVRLVPQLDDALGSLAANQSVTIQVPAGSRRDVVSVHKDAVINQRGAAMVFVIEDGQAQPRPVTLGEAVGNRFEVLSGLQPGDAAIVRGNERLAPGQPVQPAAAPQQSDAAAATEGGA